MLSHSEAWSIYQPLLSLQFMNKKNTNTSTIAHPSTTRIFFPLGLLDGKLPLVDAGPNIVTAVSARVFIIGILP